MADIIVAGNTSGSITLSAPAVSGSSVLTLPVATDTLVGKATTDTLTNKTLVTPALGTPASGILTSCTGLNYDGFKNRIINGGMVIDQRNAGASVTNNGTVSQYSIDRWNLFSSISSKFTAQQSSNAPTGFSNSLLITSSSAYSLGAGDYFSVCQKIEGFNTSDLAFGTASASSVNLSFWVKSSLTGTFGNSLLNSASNRSYPFTYTVSSANTWEQKTVTIAGDTTGTWIGATNGIGLRVNFGFGVGSTYSGTAGAWAGTDYESATGGTSVVGTSGATFYITGVQLEKGSTATSFDYRPYGTDLALCQRYYQQDGVDATTPVISWVPQVNSGTARAQLYVFPVQMRAAPTITTTGDITWTAQNIKTSSLWLSGSAGASGNTSAIYKITASGEL
jgi:hypothetical protein